MGFPGPGGSWPRGKTRLQPDPYDDGLPNKRHDPSHQTRPPAGHSGLVWSPDAALMDTVACLQLDMEELRAGSRSRRTPPPDIWTSQGPPRQTKVPRFAGVTSWEQQYKQVFDAILRSNSWDNATAALQLLSHLEGDALNVALLVPESRLGLVGALTEHSGSPGRLEEYLRQFERTTRTAGEDPSIFAIELETLAVKAFGDMGQTA